MKRYIYSVSTVNESYTFVELPQFKRDAKELKLNDSDIEELKHLIATTPPEADLGHKVYKFRWAPSRWHVGKRGATRVVYIEVIKSTECYLVTMFPKNKLDNISPAQLKFIHKMSDELRK